MDDQQIVALYLARSEEAIALTQEVYGAYLARVACNIVFDPEDSRECVNDTFLAAWNSIPPHKPQNLCTYLSKITRQLAIDVFRKKQAEKRQPSQYALSLSELEGVIPGGTDPSEVLDAKLLDESIDRFLRSLPEDTRNVFLGRYFYFDPVKEVAAYCGISEGKAKTLLHRTRKKLKEHLQKEGFFV